MRVRSLGGEDALEQEMATHSTILAWRIPWTAEPGGLQSVGSQRVGQKRSDSARSFSAFFDWFKYHLKIAQRKRGRNIPQSSLSSGKMFSE